MPVDKQATRKKSISSNEVELLYTKSKAYLHPTTSKKDNIPGYLSLSRSANAANRDIIISFMSEKQLSSEELKAYENVDIADLQDDLEALKLGGRNSRSSGQRNLNIVSKPPTSSAFGFCFSIPISFVYSIQVRKPSVGWWFGSIIINTQDGEKLPIVFFHDDESPSTLKNQKVRNQRFDPFGDNGEMYWGGLDFMNALGKFADVQKSSVEPSVYLINPESNDLRNFAPFKESKTAKTETNPEPFKLPDVNKFFASAKWKVLETIATFSAKTRNQVLDLVDENAPMPIKQIINKPEVQKIGNEFDSARVYLAKWAAQVKEEAEEAHRKYQLDDEIYNKINKELGVGSSTEILTDEEVSKTSRRKPISKVEWEGLFDFSGRLIISIDEIKDRIFHGGLEDCIRGEAWLFLLNVYPWDSSTEERQTLRNSFQTAYEEIKLKWVNDDDKRSVDFWKDQKHRIEKDINRTDRNLSIFQNKKEISISGVGSDGLPTTRESSPETPDEADDDEFDVSNITNPHLFKMREILLTYNEHNVNLGYVQGMTDLLSPLYVTFQDESLTFWAFVNFMDRMERNFLRDQSGMKNQMLTLNELVQFMLPDLFKHLEKCESTDLYFFFRMLLVWFKREFEWSSVLSLWEILWTDYYSGQFHLFFALAVLSDNERIIRQNLSRFDEVLKYMNDLSMNMNLNHLLIRAELLFLRFRRMIDIIDRENSLKKLNNPGIYDDANNSLIKISPALRELLSKKPVIQKETERPEGVGGG